MTKKKYIDIYPTIYRVDLVVANEAATLEELKELYYNCKEVKCFKCFITFFT